MAMSTALRFRQHEQFHRAALYIAIAGPLAALASAFLPGGPSLTIGLTAGATALAAMAAFGESHSRSKFVAGAVFALLGASLLVASGRWGSANLGPLLFAMLVALPMASGLRGRKLLISVAAGTAALLLARLAALHVVSASEFASLPTWASSAVAGVAVSAASIFALLPRHVQLVHDPVAKAHAQLRGQVSGEISDLVERSNKLWTQAKTELSENDANLHILEEAVLRLMHTAKRWSSADSNSSQTSAASLAERMESLQERIDKANDEVVIKQYEQARAALAEQMKYLSGISNNRERVLARMHNYLAAMERLRLAVANLKSATASRESVDLAPIVESLEELGLDIDSCSTALKELDA